MGLWGKKRKFKTFIIVKKMLEYDCGDKKTYYKTQNKRARVKTLPRLLKLLGTWWEDITRYRPCHKQIISFNVYPNNKKSGLFEILGDVGVK